MPNYIVNMRCVVYKTVYLVDCPDIHTAKYNPWDYAVNEQEGDQVDWLVMDVKENQ